MTVRRDAIAGVGGIALAALGLAACLPHLHGARAARAPLDDVAPRFTPWCAASEGDARFSRPPRFVALAPDAATLAWRADADAGWVEVWSPERFEARRFRARGDEAHLRGFEPGARLCYAVTVGTAQGPTVSFRTPRPDGPVDVVVFGDSGGSHPDQAAMARALSRHAADLVLHTGDIAYYRGTEEAYDAQFFRPFAALTRRALVAAVPGNHDRKVDGGRPFFDTFGPVPRSFDYGPLHVALLDTGGDLAAQAEWLARDLDASDRPWKLAVGHHPPFASGAHGSSLRVRRAFAAVLSRHGADLMLSGHDHHYERVRPQGGVTYVVSGGGGHSTRPVGESDFTAFAESVLHFVHLRVDPDRLVLRAVDAEGHVFDRIVLEASSSR
ncbi:MAG: metallophosphoesterase [Myxococcota bacterium]|nr:metallophosphoesterase [Myxococcota bacterium]